MVECGYFIIVELIGNQFISICEECVKKSVTNECAHYSISFFLYLSNFEIKHVHDDNILMWHVKWILYGMHIKCQTHAIMV